MQKHLLYINLFAISSALALAACSDEVENAVTPDMPEVGEKTPIELSVGGVDTPALTRAVVTDGTTNTNFGRDTKIFFLMQSEKDATVHDGYEYKGDRANTLYTVARANVVHDTSPTAIVFDDSNQKYWDDAHARSTQLTIWAFAQRIATDNDRAWPTYSFQTYNGITPSLAETSKKDYDFSESYPWQSDTPLYPAIFSWWVGNGSANQDANTLIYQDLFFSNNIANYVGNDKVPEASRTDNRLKFKFSEKKFPASTELKFYHAMSKITIQIKAGDGFKADGSDFKLKNATTGNTTIDFLRGFNVQGLFNIKDGEFQKIHNFADITSIPVTKTVHGKSEPYYTLEALAIPNIHEFMLSQRTSEQPGLKDVNSRFVDGSSEVMLQFTIDNNTYKITSDALFDAVNGKSNATTRTPRTTDDDKYTDTYVPLEAGKNYVFTFTVAKTKISGLTAQVLDWETVTADNITPLNARISLKLEERGTDYVGDYVEFYRAADPDNTVISDDYEGYKWDTGYAKDYTAKSYESSTHKWTFTDWYWPNNATFYHYRAVGDKSTSSPAAPAVNDNAFVLTAGVNYRDYIWGAPFLDDKDDEVGGDFKFSYSTSKGFDGRGAESTSSATHQIYHGIGPTNDVIKLLMFHMMSDVTIKVATTTGSDAVKLTDGDNKTTIKFENIHSAGSVALGNGLVSTTGAAGNTSGLAMSSTTNQWVYGAIPQNLDGATTAADDDVILVITTPDKNEYRVTMKEVLASSVTSANIANPYTSVTENSATKYKIDAWYPGFKYVYTFKLSKKKIESITATILEWENVVAGDDEVQIK